MTLHSTISKSLADIDRDHWRQICRDPDDPFMDPRFLQAVEQSLGDDAEIWYMLVRDQQQRPVAACCLSLYRLDACLLAAPGLKKIINGVRRLAPNALRLKVLFVGLPFSASQSHLRIAPEADSAEVVAEVNRAAEQYARQFRAPLIIYKEFSADEQSNLTSLTDLGYTAADSVPANFISVGRNNFQDYLASMRDKYRYNIKSSMRRFAEHGFEVQHFNGDSPINRLYTDATHNLYLDIVERSSTALERLPKSTIHCLGEEFGNDFQLTIISKESKPVAFACGIYKGEAYYPLLVGVDHQQNTQLELYFNLVFEHSRFTMRRPVQMVHCGASADEFKARLGAVQQSRHVFIKVRGLLKWPFEWLKPLLLKPVQLRTPHRVFKETPSSTPLKAPALQPTADSR